MNADREVSKPKQIPSNTVGCPERKGGVGKSTITALLAAGLRRWAGWWACWTLTSPGPHPQAARSASAAPGNEASEGSFRQ